MITTAVEVRVFMTCPSVARRRLRFVLRAQHLDIGDELPNLIGSERLLPRGHPVRAPLDNRAEQLCVAVAVNPVDIAEAGPHAPAAAAAVASRAVEAHEQLPAFAERGAIVRVGITGARF